MANPQFQKARANIKALRAATTGARVGEFKFTQDVLGSIYGNLGSTLGGGKAGLTSEQARLAGALRNLQQRQAAGSARVTKGASAAVGSLYGSATRGAVAPALATVAVAGKAGTKAVKGQVAAGGILARGDQAAFGTLQQGVQMAEAGAQGQLADALAYRAKNDATLVATQQLELQKARLQNTLDIQNYKAKVAIDARAAEKAAAKAGTAVSGAATAMVGIAENSVVDLQQISNDLYAGQKPEDKHVPTGAEIAAKWLENTGNQDPNQYQVILAVAGAISSTSHNNDPSPQAVSEAVMQQISLMYPDLTPTQTASLQGIMQASSSNWQMDQVAAGADPPEAPWWKGGGWHMPSAGTANTTSAITALESQPLLAPVGATLRYLTGR